MELSTAGHFGQLAALTQADPDAAAAGVIERLRDGTTSIASLVRLSDGYGLLEQHLDAHAPEHFGLLQASCRCMGAAHGRSSGFHGWLHCHGAHMVSGGYVKSRSER